MAFTREPVRTPVAIEDVSVELFSPGPSSPGAQAGAAYSVQVRYNTGEIRVLTGNLAPHLTQAQITGLLNFVSYSPMNRGSL